MRVLVIGAGGVGAAVAAVAQRRDFFERLVLADVDAVARAGRRRANGRPALRARRPSTRPTPAAIAELARAERADAILNAVDPRFNPPIFQAAFDAGCTYLDMAMTLSDAETGVKLGDAQFARGASAGRRPGGSRWSGSASSRASRTSSPATPPTSCSPRST